MKKKTLLEDLKRIHTLTYGGQKTNMIVEGLFDGDDTKADEVSDDVSAFMDNLKQSSISGLSQEEKGDMEYKKTVESMQISLVLLGYELPVHGIDGLFGPETASAVKQFMNDNQIEVSSEEMLMVTPEVMDLLTKKIQEKGISSEDLKKHVNKPLKHDGSLGEKTDGITIATYLMKKKYSKAQSAGIAGNLYVESGYKTGAIGDNGTSYGLAQWHKTRWERLNEFCESEGLDPSEAESQLIYLDWELRTREKRAYKELMKTDTPYDSAFAFAKYFERPRRINPKRMSKAEEIYNRLP